MPSLRQRLGSWKRPERYLALLLLVVVGAAGDMVRQPHQQLTARCYIGAVHMYQHYGRPLSVKIIRCHYQPTCSEYSIQAVERFGFERGLQLTLRRLSSCRREVPPGTYDPVPLR